MTHTAAISFTPHEKRFQASRKQYADHLRITECLQAELRALAEELAVSEGWDPATQEGVSAWIEDSACIFRFLKVSLLVRARRVTFGVKTDQTVEKRIRREKGPQRPPSCSLQSCHALSPPTFTLYPSLFYLSAVLRPPATPFYR